MQWGMNRWKNEWIYVDRWIIIYMDDCTYIIMLTESSCQKWEMCRIGFSQANDAIYYELIKKCTCIHLCMCI